MRPLPDAWQLPDAEWVPLAPGVRWKLKTPDGALRMLVTSEVAGVMSRVFDGRAGMEAIGLDEDPSFDATLSLDRIQGLAGVFTACLYAQHCLEGWEGIEHPKTGELLDHTDPEAVRAALIHGAPPFGQPLLAPFLAWVEAPRRPMAREAIKLRELAHDHWSGGADRCRACIDEGDACAKGGASDGEICPRLKNAPATPESSLAWNIASGAAGVWQRAGMSASVVGLDYRAALLAFEEAIPTRQQPDHGAAFACFRAIEGGRMQAEAERAEADRAATDRN